MQKILIQYSWVMRLKIKILLFIRTYYLFEMENQTFWLTMFAF